MNKIALKIIAFFFSILGLFVFISQKIPQVSSYPAKALTHEEFSKMATDQMIAKGKEIFGSGGERCSQCHVIEGPQGRGPNLGGVGAKAASRAQERTRNTGKNYTAEDYILESLIEPNSYVVQGFSAPSIMPEVYKPPLDLSEEDIKAVAAFLESLGGTVSMTSQTELRPEWKTAVASSKSAAREPVKGDLGIGKRLFYDKMRCVACHITAVDGKKIGGVLGPDLSRVGEIRGPDSLKNIIINPPGDVMPKHYKENMTEQELNDMIVFLMSLRS